MVGIFSFLTPSQHIPSRYQRQVYITNVLSFVFAWITLGALVIFCSLRGWLSALPCMLAAGTTLFISIPALNRRVSHYAGRMLFCLAPVWLAMLVTVCLELKDVSSTFIVYSDGRLILMATPVLCGLVFRLKERAGLFVCLGSGAVAVLLYDPIHRFFGAEHFQQEPIGLSYYVAGGTFLLLTAGILLMGAMIENGEAIAEQHALALQHKQDTIEAGRKEIAHSSERLEHANAVIARQQEAMEKYSTRLEALVARKSQELRRANEELIKLNNELIQFSFTVSHNLRGPVARLLGLAQLFKVSSREEEKKQLEDLVIKSTKELDSILKDLSLIIDIRNELYSVREKVIFEEEWNKACALLAESIKPDYCFDVDFSAAPCIFGVKAMIQSVFYNLLSNAIKYQSPERTLSLKVYSEAVSPLKTMVEISDNGLGIDLKNREKDIFKLYKRFHTHVPGKGLGLYLVKTQVEALDGKITVRTEPGEGTAFRIIFTQPDEVSKQVFHENDAVQLYYNGNLRVIVINWKRNITSREYRETFTVLLDSIKFYKPPGWISDVRKQGFVSDEDQQWSLKTLAFEAIKSGLKKLAVIGLDDPVRRDYHERIKTSSVANGIKLRPCRTMEEAMQWMADN